MADHFFGVNLGDSFGAVSTGTSTTSTSVEVRIADGAGITNTDAVKALEILEDYIATQRAPV